jgi:hypothetical protein
MFFYVFLCFSEVFPRFFYVFPRFFRGFFYGFSEVFLKKVRQFRSFALIRASGTRHSFLPGGQAQARPTQSLVS